MSTLADFRARPDYGLGRAFLLAFAVHAVLIAFMFIGVRMQNRPGDTVTVELWEAPPPPPPPAPVVQAPKPPPPAPPKVEPPKPPPEPEVKKPDIVEKAPPPKPKPKPKPEAKAPPKDDLEKLLLREQAAMEEQKLAEERRQIAEAQRKAESEKMARQLAAKASDKALTDYVNRIRAAVRQRWILPQDLQGNPQCIFRVVQLPTGEVVEGQLRLLKSSGNGAYDEAVRRAILAASPLPPPPPGVQFYRELELTFRPKD
ncbi:MAG TPA: TonB family protein [Burkholderiales bacterium]|jgi:colicin import membrane protein